MGYLHLETVARRKASAPPEWELCRMEWIGDSVLCEGGIPHVLTRGKNKGAKRWRGVTQRVVVSGAEIDAEELRYEAETGKCHRCLGKGETVAGWSRESGKRWKVCERCKGTKIPPSTEPRP